MDSLNILILEDDLVISLHITKTLKKLGFRNIFKATNANDALELAHKNKIDLLLSDIQLNGDLDGIETTKILQRLYSIPVIFITAYSDKTTLTNVCEVDFVGYLIKPYRVDELETLIFFAISKYKLLNNTNIINIQNYEYNKITKELIYNDTQIKLTKKEQLFISLLFSNQNTIVSYEIIDQSIWQNSYVVDYNRRTFLSRIRKKLINLDIHVEKNIGIGIFQ
jgi:DNA-binding response OmpR family regulator